MQDFFIDFPRIRLETPTDRYTELQIHGTNKYHDWEWVVWGYGGLIKNTKAKSQPRVQVVLRKLKPKDGGYIASEIYTPQIPIQSLVQFPIGSIWKEGSSTEEFSLPLAPDFVVDFTESQYELISFSQGQEPYPETLFPPAYSKKDKGWYLSFPLTSGGKLVIPCLEFFNRCYGSSGEFRRILTTYPWSERNERLYAPIADSENIENCWRIKRRKRLVKEDCVILAHGLYDSYTTKTLEGIYPLLEAGYGNQTPPLPAFLQIKPWFKGKAKLRVRGLSFDNDRSFLGLQILGCSEPNGVSIERDRENNNQVDKQAPEGSATAFGGSPSKITRNLNQIFDLTSDDDPDHQTGTLEVQSREFVILGKPRDVTDRKNPEGRYRADQTRCPPDNTNTFSGGAPHGNSKGVGHASIHSETKQDEPQTNFAELESEGALRDLWNAFIYLQNNPGIIPWKITAVEWHTPEHRFDPAQPPCLVSISPFAEADTEGLTPATTKWVYYDFDECGHGKTLRGMMVLRIKVEGHSKPIYIFDIQRRQNDVKETDKFKGVVFTLPSDDLLDEWIDDYRHHIRRLKGIPDTLLTSCPGRAFMFKHSSSKKEKVAGQAAAANALNKILPKPARNGRRSGDQK